MKIKIVVQELKMLGRTWSKDFTNKWEALHYINRHWSIGNDVCIIVDGKALSLIDYRRLVA